MSMTMVAEDRLKIKPTYTHIMQAAYQFAEQVPGPVWNVAVDIVQYDRGTLHANGSYTLHELGTFGVRQRASRRNRGPIVHKHRPVDITVTVLGRCDCGCASGQPVCAPRVAREIAVLAHAIARSAAPVAVVDAI